MQPEPPLPRPPGDDENLRRLRADAAERIRQEERMPALPTKPAPPEPAPVYGGPPPPTRRWTLRGILILIVGAFAAIAAAIWGYQKIAVPVYGGPPAPQPKPPAGPPQ